jgi:hypothetical protein
MNETTQICDNLGGYHDLDELFDERVEESSIRPHFWRVKTRLALKLRAF